MTGRRVLVIEDDAILGMLLADLLELMGHVVCGIETTEDAAVAAAAGLHPDLLLVDGRLAAGTGWGAVDRICAETPVAYVFVTGDRTLIEARPNTILLEKPYNEARLAAAIEQAVAHNNAASGAPPA